MDLKEKVALDKQAILDKIELAAEYYKSLPKLAFERSLDSEKIKLKRTHTEKTFVDKFFNKFNLEYKTILKDSGDIDTTIGTRRSIGDVFRIAYSYLGNKISLLEIIKEAQILIINKGIASNYCYQIKKRVYKERGVTNGAYYNPSEYDELGLTKAHYDLLLK